MGIDRGENTKLSFDEIYDTFWSKIYRYVTRMIGSQEAEDLTQEIFIKVANSLETFREESQLSTWIYRIATNAVIDRMRKSDYRQEKQSINLLDNLVIDNKKAEIGKTKGLGKKAAVLERQVINREMNSCIRGIVDSLPEKYRIVIVLGEIEGLKNKEIAEVLGISLDTAKIRLHRAKNHLRNELVKQCDFYWDERNEMACDRKNCDKT